MYPSGFRYTWTHIFVDPANSMQSFDHEVKCNQGKVLEASGGWENQKREHTNFVSFEIL